MPLVHLFGVSYMCSVVVLLLLLYEAGASLQENLTISLKIISSSVTNLSYVLDLRYRVIYITIIISKLQKAIISVQRLVTYLRSTKINHRNATFFYNCLQTLFLFTNVKTTNF